jgi:hypothetical protein
MGCIYRLTRARIMRARKAVNTGLRTRIPDKRILIHQVAAWEADRNAHHAKADWQFTTDDARIKLKHLYPTF